MVHVLATMRGYALANARQTKFGIVSLVGAALLGFIAAGATLLLGLTAPLDGGSDQIALVLLTWFVGRVGFAAFSGADPAMPLDFFRMLPVRRDSLARALLVLGLVDPSLFFLGIAAGSLVAFGFRHSVASGFFGIVGALLFLALTSILSTIVSALVPAGSRRRQDAGTLLAAILISAVFVTGTLTPGILAALAKGQDVVLALILTIAPTGWAGDSIALSAAGHPWAATSLGLALPATPAGSVTSRELRLWVRDPTRAGFLLISLVVGLGVCVVPLVSRGTDLLLPFAGLGTIVISAAVAGNSYGFDGPAFGLVLTIPGAERADVRGRQYAWLLLIGPYATLLSLSGLMIAERPDQWAWVLGLLPATLGAGAGVSAIVSAVAPQPLDDGGGPTPAWTIKVYATLILTAAGTVPVVALLIIGGLAGVSWIGWLGVPVGVATGTLIAMGLGRMAITRLIRRGPEILQGLASSPAGRK